VKNFPDQPLISRTERTGYPYIIREEFDADEDQIYEERRERMLFEDEQKD
jgi:hypothetical protein